MLVGVFVSDHISVRQLLSTYLYLEGSGSSIGENSTRSLQVEAGVEAGVEVGVQQRHKRGRERKLMSDVLLGGHVRCLPERAPEPHLISDTLYCNFTSKQHSGV